MLVSFVAVRNVQAQTTPVKVSHAEPLYLDLVRDLGARQGEREFNIGASFRKLEHANEYGFLAEYEFAPINRLGMEVETDFSFFSRNGEEEAEKNKLEGIKFSAQYSFLVSPEYAMSLALGYTEAIKLTEFLNYGRQQLFTGAVHNPFFVAAKRFGNDFHSLLLAGPLFAQRFYTNKYDLNWQASASLHYTISKHFIGIEINNETDHGQLDVALRPQMKLRMNKNLAIGFVTGFSLTKSKEGVSSFFRIIYEP